MKTIKILLNKDTKTYDYDTNLNLNNDARFEKIKNIIISNHAHKFNMKNEIINYVRTFIKCLDYIKVDIRYV